MATGYRLRTSKSWSETEAELRQALGLWGAETYALQRGPAPDDGAKAVRGRAPINESPEQATVSLTVRWKSGRELRLAYNQQARSVDNLRVLYLACESLRLNEVRGIDNLLREAYLQLPAPPAPKRKRAPHEVLGVAPGADLDLAEAAYRVLAKRRHPDIEGGSEAAMRELNEAIDELRKAAAK